MKKRILAITLLCVLVIPFLTCTKVEAHKGYTYNWDYFEDVQYSPDAYQVCSVISANTLGLDKAFLNAEGLFIKGDRIYICDSGNNRIIEVKRNGETEYEMVRVIDEVYGTEVNTLAKPTDIAVADDGTMFIADQDNHRILKLDQDLNVLMTFVQPVDETFNADWDFIPNKLCVDTAGRCFVIATNVNKGLIKFEPDGTFSGFIGATKVQYNFLDYLQKKFATQEQRAQMENFVPTEYDNIYMDYEGFIYACTTNVAGHDVYAGEVDCVRRLNMTGSDILIRNGNVPVIGDIDWDNAGGFAGCSLLTDVTALENDTYAVLDKNRGKIALYDDQGKVVFVFGGAGNIDGYFVRPVAIDHMGNDLFVMDSLDASITVFTNTEYGKKIFEAIDLFSQGKYSECGDAWREVLKMNGNFDLAYIGIGRALLGEKKYEEALPYFKLKYDAENYSKAFKQYRKEWVEDHVVLIFGGVFLILIIPVIIGRIKFLKWQIATSEAFQRYDKDDKNKEA